MRRKALQGVANTLCHMVDGDGRDPDDTALARLGAGTLVIDALTGESTHDGRPVTPPLVLAERMTTWLAAELARLGLAAADVRRAEVTVPYTCEPTSHAGMLLWTLTFTPSSVVATDEREYRGVPIPGRPVFDGSVQRPIGRG